MKLVFVTEARFVRDKRGNVYGDPAFGPELWARYLRVFEQVLILARVLDVETCSERLVQVSDDDKVRFLAINHYVGPLDYLKSYRRICKEVRVHVEQNLDSKFLCRLPGNLGCLAAANLIRLRIDYAVEVVGDPEEVFSNGSFDHPLRIIFKLFLSRSLKYYVGKAMAVLYVTSKVLQVKYPADSAAFVTHASNVSLDEELIAKSPKKWKLFQKRVNLLSIGSLEQMYKAPDVALEIVKLLREELGDVEVNLKWIGDGVFKQSMIERARSLGVDDSVQFVGTVDRNSIFHYLNSADIFVLPSRTEGLPRAVIEAMSIGLPVVGTNVGGIPELLDSVVMVDKNSPRPMAEIIGRLIADQSFYNAQAERNFSVAQEYRESKLNLRRDQFYNYIRDHFKTTVC
jgi:L-malate glycosyltransferase